MISGCSKGGHRHYIHDSVVFELHWLIKYAGLWPVREPKGGFQGSISCKLVSPSAKDAQHTGKAAQAAYAEKIKSLRESSCRGSRK
jgi:hypothetical protein